MTNEYQQIAERLQAAFPEGTLQTGKAVHIPVQAYIRRLEDAAHGEWSWRLLENPQVQEKEQAIVVRGELTISGATRGGIGFSYYVRDSSARSISSYKNAVSSAESDAIRNACDKFLMGWIDLAPHRDWGKNPGVGIIKQEIVSGNKNVCTRCQKPLSAEDELFRQLNNIRLSFCMEHTPAHLKKNQIKGGESR